MSSDLLRRSRRRLVVLAPGRPWLLLPVFLGYAALRAFAVAGATPRSFNDSAAYEAVTNEPLISRAFWAGYRPWTVPLLNKVLPASDAWRVAGAVAVSVICWSVLALVVANLLRDERLKWAGMLGVLAFSLTYPVIRWDPLLLTESVSLSLTALVVAAWLSFGRSQAPGFAAWVVGSMVLWIFVRDTHAYVALVVAAALVVVAWRSSSRSVILTVAGAIVLASVLAIVSTSTDEGRPRRLERPLLHVIGGRIIPDAEAAAWFQEQGMPLNPEVRAIAPTLGFAAAPEPTAQTEPFYRWVRAEGRGTLMRYLVSHPLPSAGRVVSSHGEIFGTVDGYPAEGTRTIVPRFVVLGGSVFVLLALLFVGAAAARYRRQLSRPFLLVTFVGLLAQVPFIVLVVHGDTIELGRHAVGISITTKLLILLLGVAALDAMLATRRGRTRPGCSSVVGPVPSRS